MKTVLDKISELTNKWLEKSCDDESESKIEVSDDSDSYCSGENDTKVNDSVSPDTPNTFGHVFLENTNSSSTVTDSFIDTQIQNDSVSIVNTFHHYKTKVKLASK